MPASLKQIGARNMFQKFQNAILLAPVVENLLELATIAFMLNYSKSFLPVHYERPISGMAFPVADDEGFGQSQIPLPLLPPIKSANCLCFKLSSKLCLNCNLCKILTNKVRISCTCFFLQQRESFLDDFFCHPSFKKISLSMICQ